MTLRLRQETLRLELRDPFRIARADHGAGDAVTTVVVELVDDDQPGIVGLGEGYPTPYYGETPETIAAVLPILLAAAGPLDPTAAGARRASERIEAAIRGHGAAKCALDLAVHDLVGKVAGRSVAELLDLPPIGPPTDFSLGLDEPELVAERARRAAAFPALKIKVGGPGDVATLEAVRRVYDGPIRVDANTGWTPEGARDLLPRLIELGVELVEQPFPAARTDWLADLQAASSLPVVADESCVTIEDLDRLVGVVAGVNVKVAKCGGVGAAERMLRRARELGFRVFLGCMEETSLAIAGAAAVSSLAEWVDLDGPLLLADDPFEGPRLGPDHRWILPDKPGLGVRRRA